MVKLLLFSLYLDDDDDVDGDSREEEKEIHSVPLIGECMSVCMYVYEKKKGKRIVQLVDEDFCRRHLCPYGEENKRQREI